MKINIRKILTTLAMSILPFTFACADVPWQFQDDTRYMALGDSLAAGYGAQPATQGYVYRLYKQGVFDSLPNTLFSNASVPGATSQDVLLHQVPQVDRVHPNVITLTVGGNDLLRILSGDDPVTVLEEFQNNLYAILASLRDGYPDAEIIVSNLYTISEIPGADDAVFFFNGIVDGVAALVDGVLVADVYSAFQGRNGLLLIDRNGAGQFEVHPTNAGYRAMADAFEEAFSAP